MDTVKIKSKKTKMIAHRGLSSLEKENTIASFIAASNRSYFGCECDIHESKDGIFYVCHDNNIKRVSGIDKNITDSMSSDLNTINLIDNFDKENKNYYLIPSFIDYLKVMKKYDKFGIVEYKENISNEQVKKVIDLINNYYDISKIIFISFHKEPLVYTKKLLVNNEVELLVSEFNDEVFKFSKENNIGLDADYHILNKDIIKMYHKSGLKVNAWTVNDKEVAKRLIKYHIDYITTDILE